MSTSVVEVWQPEEAEPLVPLQVIFPFSVFMSREYHFSQWEKNNAMQQCSQLHEHVWTARLLCSSLQLADVCIYMDLCAKYIIIIISSTVLTFYSRVCSYLNIKVKPAPGVHLPCGSSFPFVHGVHCGLPSVFHTWRAPVLLLGHVTLDPCFSSVKLCCAWILLWRFHYCLTAAM